MKSCLFPCSGGSNNIHFFGGGGDGGRGNFWGKLFSLNVCDFSATKFFSSKEGQNMILKMSFQSPLFQISFTM